MSADALIGLLALVAFFTLFYGPWQNAMADLAGNFVFESRDAIFDMAVRGKIDFSSEQYIEIRKQLQSLIRFSHEASLPSMIWIYANSKKDERNTKGSIFNVIDSIEDRDVSNEIRRVVQRALSAYLAIIGLKSLPFVFPFFFYVPIYMCFREARRVSAPFKLKASQIVQWEASRAG
jgi:hypothetical protein